MALDAVGTLGNRGMGNLTNHDRKGSKLNNEICISGTAVHQDEEDMSKVTLWSRNFVSTYNSSSPAVEAAIELNMAENMPAPPITPLPT